MQSRAKAPARRASGAADRLRKFLPAQRAPGHDEPDREQHGEHDSDAAPVTHRRERRGDHHPNEAHDVAGARAVSRVTTVADGDVPHEVHGRERDGVQQRQSPSARDQHRDAHGDHHRHADAGAHQRGTSCGQPEHVAAIEGAVVIGQQQVPEAEGQRADETHLERQHDVLVPAPEEHQDRGHDGRRPRSNADAPHDRAHEQGGGQVQDDDDELVRPVAVETEQPPQHAVHEDRQGDPVLVVRAEEISEIAGGSTGEEVPLVEIEPHRPRDRHVHDEGDRLREHEDGERGTRRYVVFFCINAFVGPHPRADRN